jgi:hypothetical protein
MPTYLAGQSFDLMDSPENIIKNLIRDRWNIEADGLIPAKSAISFTLQGWTGTKSYQISVEPSSPPFIQHLSTPPNMYTKYNDPLVIHVWIVKNRDEVPPTMHHITQKIEQLVFENVTNVGYGITAMQLIAPFSAIEVREYFSEQEGMQTSFQNPTEQSLWHSQAVVELIYFKVTTNPLQSARVFKTHKYNVSG